jgi:hypothetical protein
MVEIGDRLVITNKKHIQDQEECKQVQQ